MAKSQAHANAEAAFYDGSKPLPSARHEAFAQHLAKGKSGTAAYQAAGYTAGRRDAASRLSANVNVTARVAFLQAKGAKRLEVTVESLSIELEQARAAAMTEKQISAAVSAVMGKAKLHGKLIERKHHTGQIGTYDLSKLTDEQLKHLESILGPLADPDGDQGGED